MVAGVMKNYYDLVFAAEDIRSRGRTSSARASWKSRTGSASTRASDQKSTCSRPPSPPRSVRRSSSPRNTSSARRPTSCCATWSPTSTSIALPRINPVHRWLLRRQPSADRPLMRDAVANRIEYQQAQEQLDSAGHQNQVRQEPGLAPDRSVRHLGANGLRPARARR